MNSRLLCRSVIVAFALVISGCQNQQANPGAGQPAANGNAAQHATYMAMYQRLSDTGFAQGDTSVVDSLLSDDAVDHEAMPGMPAGREGLKQIIMMFKHGYPDLKLQIVDSALQGDKLWVYTVMTGTNTGEFMGMKATGKPVKVEGFDIVRFANDKMVEHWGISDNMAMMQQLGVTGGPGGGHK